MSVIGKLKRQITISSRTRKLQHFYSLFESGDTVLDVGFTNETSRKVPDTTNFFLKNYRYPRNTYTGLSIEKTDGMEKIYPNCRFVSYRGGRFPFEDDEFDWIFSNAVIEHVGDYTKQNEFLNEMLRVGKKVFFTTPNKYFPVESHSNILFLHWSDYIFYKYCAPKKPGCSREELFLFSRNHLETLLKDSHAQDFTVYCNRLAFITMTFTVVCRK